MTSRIYPAGYCGHWPEFTHTASKTCRPTVCSSRAGCSLRTQCFSRVRPPSLCLQSSLALQLMRLFLLASSASPVWVGFPELLETVQTGDVVLVNGIEGLAVINPDSQALQRYEGAVDEVRKRKETMVQDSCIKRTVTLDGIEVSVMANVRSREDVELAMEGGADGIGLFRTEPFFMSAKHFPSDKEFAEFLLDSLRSVQGKHIDVRLLDIGADKNPPYLHLPPEPDPFLGRRGVRVLREYPDLLEAQLRAVLEVSQQFRIGVMIPMVTTESDVVQVARRLHELAAEMGVARVATYRCDDRNAGSGIVNPLSEEAPGLFQHRL
jgi:phosphoenolpyruvate-protein kinase (PTS system EI component)